MLCCRTDDIASHESILVPYRKDAPRQGNTREMPSSSTATAVQGAVLRHRGCLDATPAGENISAVCVMGDVAGELVGNTTHDSIPSTGGDQRQVLQAASSPTLPAQLLRWTLENVDFRWRAGLCQIFK